MPDDTEETAPAERAHRIEIRPRLPGPRQPETETSNAAEFPLNFHLPRLWTT
jgi:hypothetical protein